MTAARRKRRRIVVWVAALLLAYGVLCWVAAGRLLAPARRLPHAGNSGPMLEEVELLTGDGLRLAAWVLEPPGEAHGTLLLLHGKDGSRQASRLAFAAEHGFRALAVDSRAHGASEGHWTTFGWTERHDVRAACLYARARWPEGPLIGWGTSQGAAALLYFLEEFASGESDSDLALGSRPFEGLILESLYVDIDTAFRNRVNSQLGAWVLPFVWPVRQLVALRTGIDPEWLAPAEVLGRLTARAVATGMGVLADVPILIATGTADVYSTIAEAEQLAAAAAPGQTVLVLVPGRRHEDLLAGGMTVYAEALADFLHRFRP